MIIASSSTMCPRVAGLRRGWWPFADESTEQEILMSRVVEHFEPVFRYREGARKGCDARNFVSVVEGARTRAGVGK